MDAMTISTTAYGGNFVFRLAACYETCHTDEKQNSAIASAKAELNTHLDEHPYWKVLGERHFESAEKDFGYVRAVLVSIYKPLFIPHKISWKQPLLKIKQWVFIRREVKRLGLKKLENTHVTT